MHYVTLIGGPFDGQLAPPPWYGHALYRGVEIYTPRRFLLPDRTVGERWVWYALSRRDAVRTVTAHWLAGTRW